MDNMPPDLSNPKYSLIVILRYFVYTIKLYIFVKFVLIVCSFQWPAPNKMKQKTSLGPHQATGLCFPAYTCGIRRENTMNKKGQHIIYKI